MSTKSSLFDIPLYYISFKRNVKLERDLEKAGYRNVNHFPAIDGRQFHPYELLKKDLIGIRSYSDLISGREQHSGLPSLGAVGCTMSHHAIWKKCIEDNIPKVIIAEDDVHLYPLKSKDIKDIQASLSDPRGVFVTSDFFTPSGGTKVFNGTQLYFMTNGACIEAVKKAFPIEVQTDFYLSHLNHIGDIKISARKLSHQNRTIAESSIQDVCVKCSLPNTFWPYAAFTMVCVVIVLVLVMKLF